MRAIVLSDSHGREGELRRILERCWETIGPVDAYLHCGDGAMDFQRAEAFIRRRDPGALMLGVRGNCDLFCDEPESRIVALGGVRLMMTHGHRFQVKQTYEALEAQAARQGCQAAVFGHTHLPMAARRQVLMVNPGSAAKGSLALLRVEGGRIEAELMDF